MNVINWNLILQKPELYEYLPILDIIELSLANNLVREKLKFVLFSRFDIAKYFNKEHESEVYRDLEYNDIITRSSYYDKYLSKIKLNLLNLFHKKLVKHLFYNETIPFGFISFIFLEIFPNLTHLEFIMVKVPLESILNVFTTLKSLGHLSLHSVGIIKLKNDNYGGSNLIFSSSLKSLKFCNLELVISKSDINPSLLNYNNELDMESIQPLYIHPQHLPNLQNLIYFPKISSSLTQNTLNLLHFINLNKNLKYIHTLPRYLDKDTTRELNNNDKLNKLKLGMFYKHTEIPNTAYTPINSVTNLDINLNLNGINYFEEACKLFPNVKTLHLYSNYQSQQLYANILTSFSKLSNLTLKSKEGIPTAVLKSFNLPNLKAIFLKSRSYRQYNLSHLDHISNLTRITIEWEDLQGFDNLNSKEDYSKFLKWECYFYSNRIQCYKI